jgi:predicted GNAT family acetyltransferase
MPNDHMNPAAGAGTGAGTDPDVTHVPERRRYEIATGGERAGFVAYVQDGDHRIFHHTEIEERFAGRGLASKLVAAALTDTRADGRRVVAVCPFVARYVGRHHDFDDILDPVSPAALAAVSAATRG